MTFADIVSALSEELGIEIEIEGDTCSIRSDSADDFQKMSSGTYNAGNLLLTKSGKLDIANNHKSLSRAPSLNVTSSIIPEKGDGNVERRSHYNKITKTS